MPGILVVGSLNMDLVVQVERMPVGGETVSGGDLKLIPGGKGANQAAAAARLGATVAMVGCVGDDAFGPGLIDNLRRQGVATGHVRTVAHCATGTAMIVVDRAGQNSIVVSAAANERLGREEIDALQPLWPQVGILLLQFETPTDTVLYAARMARRHGIQVILNPAPARPISPELLAHVHYLVPNESEATLLTGIDVRNVPSAERAARQLLGQGVPVVIVTLGASGALLCTADGTVHVPARKVQAVDTTAAGDAFIGGLAAALTEGLPREEAVRYATLAGTLAVTRLGAQTSLPSAAEVQALVAAGPAAGPDRQGDVR